MLASFIILVGVLDVGGDMMTRPRKEASYPHTLAPLPRGYTMKILGTDISLTPNKDTCFQIFLLDIRVVWVEEETPLCSLLKLCTNSLVKFTVEMQGTEWINDQQAKKISAYPPSCVH